MGASTHVKQAFLASPPLVVAYAIAGTYIIDIERAILGTDQNGESVLLADIWPGDEEIDAIVNQAVKPEQFSAVYDPMFVLKDVIDKPTRSTSGASKTYIRRPPYWEGALAGERTLSGMRPPRCLVTTSLRTTYRRQTPYC